jgi:hypothetical protein
MKNKDRIKQFNVGDTVLILQNPDYKFKKLSSMWNSTPFTITSKINSTSFEVQSTIDSSDIRMINIKRIKLFNNRDSSLINTEAQQARDTVDSALNDFLSFIPTQLIKSLPRIPDDEAAPRQS